jgi:hypothetical protein
MSESVRRIALYLLSKQSATILYISTTALLLHKQRLFYPPPHTHTHTHTQINTHTDILAYHSPKTYTPVVKYMLVIFRNKGNTRS